MIGKPLSQRHTLGALAPDRAIAILKETLASQGRNLVEIRAQDASMIACLFVRADKLGVRVCRELGFRLELGATGAFGLHGADAARLFAEQLPHLAAHREWLETPCGPRETKVLLVAGGTALLSISIEEAGPGDGARRGPVEITALAASREAD